MRETKMNEMNLEENVKKEKILFMLLPFWTPLIPPLGIACLKSHLKKYGYTIRTVDANLEVALWDIYYEYSNKMREFIPEDKRGNYFNIGNNIMRNHFMAFINKKNAEDYYKLIKLIVKEHFFYDILETQIDELDKTIQQFYIKLEKFILNLLEKEKPDLVGISVYSGNLPASVFAFRLIKKHYPDITTVMGGGVFADQLSIGSPSFNRFIENTPYIDKFIVGEGEVLFLKYLQKKLPKDQRVYSIADNKGEYLPLEEVQEPDFSDFDLQAYTQLATYVSRSCPFQCKFCSETVQWGDFRKKDIHQVADELHKLKKVYQSQIFLLGDSLLNLVVSDLSEELNARESTVYWDGYLRADKQVCDHTNTVKWRKGGFYRARLGLESGSQHVLDLMDKKITPELIKSSVSSLAYAGIKTTTYWVVGYPGETEEDFQQTLDLIEEMKDDIWEAECNAFWYFKGAQVGSNKFEREYGSRELYPEQDLDMLMVQTHIVDCEPTREETYKRVSRFVAHCKKLGIPNPYTLQELYQADKRWKGLHKYAVPYITDFRNSQKEVNDEGLRLLK